MTTTRTSSPTSATSHGRMIGLGVLLVVLAGIALVLCLVWGDGAPKAAPPGIPTPGELTGWGLPVTTLIVDLAAVMTIGLCLISLLLPPGGPDTGAGDLAARPLLWTALVWAAAVSAQALLSMSDLYAVPAGDLTRSQMTRFLEHTNLGTAQWVTVVMVLVIALLSRYVRTRPGSTALLALSLLALAPTVLTGHAATAPSRDTAVASLLVHVVAVSLWVGGLASLAWIAVLRPAVLPTVIGRFSSLAGWCFAAVLISGTVNATIRLATANDPFGSGYGQLVLLKVLALAGLGAFGLTHRLRTVDALAEGHDPRGTRRLFFRVASAELCLMAATIGIAVALSRTPTPVGSQSHAAPALHVSTQVRS